MFAIEIIVLEREKKGKMPRAKEGLEQSVGQAAGLCGKSIP